MGKGELKAPLVDLLGGFANYSVNRGVNEDEFVKIMLAKRQG
jgi:hypothetical protein